MYAQEVCGWINEKANRPVWAKMTPNITDITNPARTALAAGCEGVAAINTITSGLWLFRPFRGFSFVFYQNWCCTKRARILCDTLWLELQHKVRVPGQADSVGLAHYPSRICHICSCPGAAYGPARCPLMPSSWPAADLACVCFRPTGSHGH